MIDRAPDLTRPVIGFRGWALRDGELTSVTDWRERWDSPSKRARCRVHEDVPGAQPHDAPDADCACGIYAFHSPHHVHGEVRGVVELWGRLLVCRKGVRAQHARIKALVAEGTRSATDVFRVANRLGVYLLPPGEFWLGETRYGTGVPPELLPSYPLLRYREVDPKPMFRFVFPANGRFMICPYGCGAEGLEEYLDIDGSVGDVFALDDKRAVAVFAFAGVTRARAAQALLAWAEKDHWHLGISPDDAPLARLPEPAFTEQALCTRCRVSAAHGFKERMKMSAYGYTHTGCWRCGGRLAWRR